MRISENRPEMLALKCYCRAQAGAPDKYRGNNAIGVMGSCGRGIGCSRLNHKSVFPKAQSVSFGPKEAIEMPNRLLSFARKFAGKRARMAMTAAVIVFVFVFVFVFVLPAAAQPSIIKRLDGS